MKPVTLFSAVLLLNGASLLFSYAEEATISEQARVLGEISDGKPSAPSPPKELPVYNIKWSKVEYKHGRKVTINNIEKPVVAVKPKTVLTEEQIAQNYKEWQTKIKDIKESGGIFMVSATIYDHKATHVRWWYEGGKFEAWSNVDWNYLGGFIGFEGRNKQYDMMLFSGDVSTQSLKYQKEQGYRVTIPEIPPLPSLEKQGASYTVTKGDETNEQAMEFIEAIHDLYAAEETRLKVAYHERKKNHAIWREKQEEIRKNPPPKPDLTINFWERDVVKERQEQAAKQKGEQR